MTRHAALVFAGSITFAAIAEVPTPDVLLRLPFAGNALDIGPLGNNGTLNGAQLSADRFGQTNSAVHFNGRGDFVETDAAFPDTKSIAISLWLSLDSWVELGNWGAPQVVFFEGDDGGGHDVGLYVMGGFHFTVKSDDTLSYSSWLPPLHTWIHLVCQADSVTKTMSMWVNGRKAAERDLTGDADVGFHSRFNLGRRPGVYNDWFLAGSMDDVKVYSHALSEQEIATAYAAERGAVVPVEIAVETVRLSLNVVPGNSYRLQSSSDLSVWSDYGQTFVASAAQYQTSVNVVESGRFWRLVQMP